MALFLLALDRGERALVDQAIAQLRESLAICAELNLLPQWWAHRVAIHLLSDLWSNTFHEKLPLLPAGGDAAAWPGLRELFIALAADADPRAEVDLWPSQIEAAARAVDQSDDLVVSLPTSAGKTRIAELCILRCLAGGKRVMFVTPLRALSAQTETTLQRTFGPLGKTISALYGSIGVSGFDEDAIRERDIVVATPEKLDFALRNDPSLLDDVGLLVFDEGHMIGPSEREVRYEVQIQRLLRRHDADQRRIVCLSAILPMATSSTTSPLGSAATSPGGADQARLATDAAALRRSGLEFADGPAEPARRRRAALRASLPHRSGAAALRAAEEAAHTPFPRRSAGAQPCHRLAARRATDRPS